MPHEQGIDLEEQQEALSLSGEILGVIYRGLERCMPVTSLIRLRGLERDQAIAHHELHRELADLLSGEIPPRLDIPATDEHVTINSQLTYSGGHRRRTVMKIYGSTVDGEIGAAFTLAQSFTAYDKGPFILFDAYDERVTKALRDAIIERRDFVYVPGGDRSALVGDIIPILNDPALLTALKMPSYGGPNDRSYYCVPDDFDDGYACQWILQVRRTMQLEMEETRLLGRNGFGQPISTETAEQLLAKVQSGHLLPTRRT